MPFRPKKRFRGANNYGNDNEGGGEQCGGGGGGYKGNRFGRNAFYNRYEDYNHHEDE